MKMILLIAALVMPTSAWAGDLASALAAKYPGTKTSGSVELAVDNFYVDGGIAKAVLRFTNHTGRNVSKVFASCAFLDGSQNALNVGRSIVSNLPAGQTAFDVASVVENGNIEYATCRVDSFNG